MNKTFFKKFLIYIPIVAFIVALITSFCNHLCTAFLNQVIEIDATPAQTLGDRGGSHLPDAGVNLPTDSWFLILMGTVAIVSFACIVTLIVLKVKLNKKQKSEQNASTEQNEEAKESNKTSLKTIVARNLENDKKEYEKIDNPKH